jgi:ferredoxin--NADP+ reductase/benzoate/toluate 1,2-dioxygenase reductase subunit
MFTVLGVRHLTNSAFIIRMDRKGLKFIPGQNLNLGLTGDTEKRDYSIYSAVDDDFLEILVKEVEDGLVSKKLKKLQPGDHIEVDGPFGFFTIADDDRAAKKFVFIASGSGIAPFHCFAGSYPGLDYKLLHGVRNSHEAYEKHHYPADRYVSCLSKDNAGDFRGRVTEYLKRYPFDPECLFYLCGNVNMIYDAFDILKEQGVPSGNLHAEVYF